MNKIIQLIDRINIGIRVILAINITIMSIVITAQVVGRYVFQNTFTGAEELSRYLMIFSVFLGSAIAVRTHSLIAVEVVAELLPGQGKRFLKIGVYILCLAFFVLLFILGYGMLDNVSGQLSPALQLSMSIPYAAIPIGAGALILNTVAVLLELFQNKPFHEDTPGGL